MLCYLKVKFSVLVGSSWKPDKRATLPDMSAVTKIERYDYVSNPSELYISLVNELDHGYGLISTSASNRSERYAQKHLIK